LPCTEWPEGGSLCWFFWVLHWLALLVLLRVGTERVHRRRRWPFQGDTGSRCWIRTTPAGTWLDVPPGCNRTDSTISVR
ncbi:hypothetical protein PENTCL1PPCAC_26340, partial [Pristionchus entomophagus]